MGLGVGTWELMEMVGKTFQDLQYGCGESKNMLVSGVKLPRLFTLEDQEEGMTAKSWRSKIQTDLDIDLFVNCIVIFQACLLWKW